MGIYSNIKLASTQYPEHDFKYFCKDGIYD